MRLAPLTQPVGVHQPNLPADVTVVQTLLNRHAYATHLSLTVDGSYGHHTERAIYTFQRIVLATRLPNGIIPVSGPVIDRLGSPHVAAHLRKKASAHKSNALSEIPESELQAAAASLSSPNSPCEVAAIRAVAEVETKGDAFDSQGRPVILFERHVFSRLTKGKWNASHPQVSDPTSGGYSDGGTQYERLDQAQHLDSSLALEAASWGAFQILGENYKQAGFSSVEDFVKAMQTDIHAHLKAFVTFIKNSRVLLNAIQKKQWKDFALAYNGRVGKKGHYTVRNNYDGRLADAYAAAVKAQNPVPGLPGAPPRMP